MKRSQCRLPLVTCSSQVMQWIETTLSKLATFPDIYLVTFRFVQCISAVKLLESDVLLKRLRVFSRNWSYLYYVIGFVAPGFSVCVWVCLCVGEGGPCHTRRKSPAVQLHSLYRITYECLLLNKNAQERFQSEVRNADFYSCFHIICSLFPGLWSLYNRGVMRHMPPRTQGSYQWIKQRMPK